MLDRKWLRCARTKAKQNSCVDVQWAFVLNQSPHSLCALKMVSETQNWNLSWNPHCCDNRSLAKKAHHCPRCCPQTLSLLPVNPLRAADLANHDIVAGETRSVLQVGTKVLPTSVDYLCPTLYLELLAVGQRQAVHFGVMRLHPLDLSITCIDNKYELLNNRIFQTELSHCLTFPGHRIRSCLLLLPSAN